MTSQNGNHTKLQVGSVARKRKPRRFQIPLWLFLLIMPFGTLALVIVIQRVQDRREFSADYATLQGDWEIECWTKNGETFTSPSGTWSISGNMIYSSTSYGDKFRYFSIDVEKSPTEIMIRPTDETKRRSYGIYSLDHDTLTICFESEKNPHPRTFSPSPNDGNMLLVLRRIRK